MYNINDLEEDFNALINNLDEEFSALMDEIRKEVVNCTNDEQTILQAWMDKLCEPATSESQRKIRNHYAETLRDTLTQNSKPVFPFTEMPPRGDLNPVKTEEEDPPHKKPSPGKTPMKDLPPKSPPKEASPDKSPGGFSPGRGTISKQKPPPEESDKETEEEEGEGEAKSSKPKPVEEGKVMRPPKDSSKEGKDGGKEKPKFNYVRLPCTKRPGEGTGAIPRSNVLSSGPPDYFETHVQNEFEDLDEMAKIIARSKGQSFAEFVVAISRHTADFGLELRTCMKVETSTFREYVDHVLSQRIKDLTEVLNREQNTELEKIKKDIDKWQLELSHCKKRIKEIIPDFDINLFKKDKNYLKKVFAVDFSSALPSDESAKLWKDETRIRLTWFCEMVNKMIRCNDRLSQELNSIKSKTLELEGQESIRIQKYMQFLNAAIFECQKLKDERDRLSKENALILSEIQDLGI